MRRKKDKDEFLEQLWYMKEKAINSIDSLKHMGDKHFDDHVFDEHVFNELIEDGLVEIDTKNNTVSFTEKGEKNARQIIRAHRLAERLIRDILDEEFEAAAGEFEHTITPELVDGICTLLGHPRECPHGRPIPEGKCCKGLEKIIQTSVVPLTELEVGQAARIAYVQSKNDQQMHRIDGLQIRPGAHIKLHQKYPAFVVECEGMSIALDHEIVSNIRVWSKEVPYGPPFKPREKGFFSGFGFRHRKKKGRKGI